MTDVSGIINDIKKMTPKKEKKSGGKIDSHFKPHLKALGENLKRLCDRYEQASAPRLELYEIYAMMVRGENPFHRYSELPNHVVNATHPACDTAESKMIAAIFESDVVHRYRPRQRGDSDKAERVQNFIQQRVKRDMYNMAEEQEALRFASRFGTGIVRVSSDEDSHVTGIFDPFDFADTDEARKLRPKLNLSGTKNVRCDAVHPNNFFMWPCISHVNRQAFVIENCYYTEMDVQYMIDSGSWDKTESEKVLKHRTNEGRWTNSIRTTWDYDYVHPYYNLEGSEDIIEHKVAVINRIDGWRYILVDEEFVVYAGITENNIGNGGHPYAVHKLFPDAGWAYGFGIPAMIISLQDRLNTLESMNAFMDLMNTFPNMVVNSSAVDDVSKWNEREIGQTLYTKGPPDKNVTMLPTNPTSTQLVMAQSDRAFSNIERVTGITSPVLGMDARSHRTASEASITDRNAHSRLDGAVRGFMTAINHEGRLLLRETKRMFENGDFEEIEYYRTNTINGETFAEINQDHFGSEFDVECGIDFSIASGPAKSERLISYLQIAASISPETLTHPVKHHLLKEILKGWDIAMPERFLSEVDHLKSSRGHMDYILAYKALPPIGDNDLHEFHVQNEQQWLSNPMVWQDQEVLGLIQQHIQQHLNAYMVQMVRTGQMTQPQGPGGQQQGQQQQQQQGITPTDQLQQVTGGPQPAMQG